MDPFFKSLPAVRIVGYAIRSRTEGGENIKAIPDFWSEYMTDGRMEWLHSEDFVANHAEYWRFRRY